MGRRNSVRSGGGSANWPGTSAQLVRGDGAAVTVGSGLTLSGATLVGPADGWFASSQASIVAKLGLSASTFAVALDDFYTGAGQLGWSGLTAQTSTIGGVVTAPQSPTSGSVTGVVMSKTSTSYGFGFRAQVNPATSGDETYLGVSNLALNQYVIAILGNAAGTKYIKAQLNDGGASGHATGNSTVTPDASFHTVLVAFKYAAGASVLSISVDGETWIDSAPTSKNPTGQAGFMWRAGASVALVDKSIFIASY